MVFPFQLLVAPMTTLIERLFPDKAQQDKAKAELMTIMAQSEATKTRARADVVIAEAKGESWLQRNWRPLTMLIFNLIIAFNFLFCPILGMFGIVVPFLPIPADMWYLLTLGITGYVVDRGITKRSQIKFNSEAYFDSLREYEGGLSQKAVDAYNKALKAGMGDDN